MGRSRSGKEGNAREVSGTVERDGGRGERKTGEKDMREGGGGGEEDRGGGGKKRVGKGRGGREREEEEGSEETMEGEGRD